MAQITLPSIETYTTDANTRAATRLYFIDHLRAALVILVVLHHLAIVYGEGISFWYVDPPQMESFTGFAMVLFVLFNQAWFMGAFFLLAGYFTPGSFERKGTRDFLKDRLIRLGIPLAIWLFVINPFVNLGLFLEPVRWISEPLTWQNFWAMYPDFIGFGVAWFLALLLIFSFGYAIWRRLTEKRTTAKHEPSTPTYRGIAAFIILLAAATYLMRIAVPIGRSVLDFPTLAYLPQYLSFFVVGIVAYRRDWFRSVPDRMGKIAFVTAIVATLVLFPIPILGMLGGTMRFLGNGSWPSAVYALWDSTIAVSLCLAGITFFRRYVNRRSEVGTFLAQQSYAVYVIHSPIIVVLAYAFYRTLASNGMEIGAFIKFCIASIVIVPVCYVVAYGLRKIPGVSRVL